jgi:hypothetical protein
MANPKRGPFQNGVNTSRKPFVKQFIFERDLRWPRDYVRVCPLRKKGWSLNCEKSPNEETGVNGEISLVVS